MGVTFALRKRAKRQLKNNFLSTGHLLQPSVGTHTILNLQRTRGALISLRPATWDGLLQSSGGNGRGDSRSGH